MTTLPFVVRGRVAPGKRLGTRLGFPTANIAYDSDSRAWPPDGVYVGIAEIDSDQRRYAAILNQGKHPTVPEGAPTVEAHLLGYSNHALYGRRLTLCYRHYLRPEQAFPSLEALVAQLQDDRRAALAWVQAYEPSLIGPFSEASQSR